MLLQDVQWVMGPFHDLFRTLTSVYRQLELPLVQIGMFFNLSDEWLYRKCIILIYFFGLGVVPLNMVNYAAKTIKQLSFHQCVLIG